jgi:predicted kinase
VTVLAVLSGLPGSGKTTYARQIQADVCERVGRPGTTVVVSRDTIREHALGLTMGPDDQILDRAGEAVVTALENAMVEAALAAPDVRIVIVDATHLVQKYVDQWRSVATRHGAYITVIDMGISVEECIRRDATRAAEGGRHVGEDVIRRLSKLPRIVPPPS